MALPVTIPNTFANATTSIPLSQLDNNFSVLATAINGINSGSETLANLKASNVTITGGTISNVTLDNVTVDVETFSNVTLSNVTITSGSANLTTANATVIIAGAGTSAAPSIQATGDPNTGIFFPAADTIAFAEGGAEAMRIDSSGNVLVGTTTAPGVNGGGMAIYSPTITRLTLRNSTTGDTTTDGLSIFANGNDVTYNLVESGYQRWTTSDTERMRIDSSGNVGIGTTTARGRLTVSDGDVNTAGEAVYQAYIVGTARTPSTDATGMLTIQSTNAMAANTGGSIAFGGRAVTSSASGANWAFISGLKENGTSSNYGGYLSFATRDTVGGGTTAERARITSGGDFYVGTISASNPGTILFSGGNINTTVSASATNCIQFWNQATSGDNLFATFYTEGGSGTLRGSIDFNRGATQVRYNTTSDATLKNIIGDSDGKRSLEILNATCIREYAWKNDPTQKPQIGVIAQELYETYKGAVSVGGEYEIEIPAVTEQRLVSEAVLDEEGNEVEAAVYETIEIEPSRKETKYRPWAVDKTAFTFHLIAGWQAHEKLLKEAMTRIEALEAEVAALKAK